MDVLLTDLEPILSEAWLVALDEFFSADIFLEDVCDSLLEDTDPWRDELVDTFLDSVAEDDILIEVVSEADLVSLEELSFKNSLAELNDLGGEEDLELALEDFRDDEVDAFEVFLIEVVELFRVEVADDCPSLIIPRLIASSSAISFPVSGSVKIPVFSSIRPLRRAS